MPQRLPGSAKSSAGLSPHDTTAGTEECDAIFAVQGMWCSSCAFAIEHFLKKQPGVLDASVNFVTATALVRWSPNATGQASLERGIASLGYRLTSQASTQDSRERLARARRTLIVRLGVSIAFGMWTLMASALLYFNYGLGPRVDWIIALVASLLALPVVSYAGLPFYRAAWRTLRAGHPGMDVLVSLGVISAMLFSAWHLWRGSPDVYVDTAVMLITLLLIGRLVELASRQDGMEALASLDSLSPESAKVWRHDRWETRKLEDIQCGDRVHVDAQATLPFDGSLDDDRALIDRAVLTGETTPVLMTRGDRVEAGCVNAGPALTLRVEAPLGQRYIDSLRNRTLQLYARKGEFQKVSDSVARWLPSTALGLAVGTFILVLARGAALDEAFAWSLSVLIVACPCAVGLAIPVVTQAATARGLRQGIVFKDLSAFETLAKARSIAFDKTGTLTTGQLGIHAIHTACGVSGDDVLRLAAQAEQGITHPVAQTLRRHAVERGLTLVDDLITTHYPSQGIAVREPQGDILRVGSPRWLKEQGIDLPEVDDNAGKLVGVARGERWLGTLILDETLTRDAAAAVAHFRDASFTLALLSGDQAANVHTIGQRGGFRRSERFAELTPDAKARLVDALPKPSVFVGDGINDTLALATATTGISVAGATPQARDIASVSLLTTGIGQAWQAHRLARSAYRLMRQNLVFSVAYNALALGLAVWMPIPPVIAAGAMAFSSVSVLANAARLYIPPDDDARAQKALHESPGQTDQASEARAAG
ncbi:cation-translocating P-type ATPase [Halomonas sp. McH1-25]|uniref:heavy metal translocating P-type ATPase n=1 Tax=unclassified Halomonas TaxID=2609666 RepID=UPI001EF6340B|nr:MULTISPECIES: cation-translocating P-type ATPase [unclassified Halomonas]MCG7601955.1 cation-translocating P-type ATPase [Halomonas sp. McH1-25]MCP1341604.1 cation-translocating P-type ATPase [Halomonas sp. FL8]MCP1362412.1 cation-translocating P-type ATPase [Halomonas sp. BBD45]